MRSCLTSGNIRRPVTSQSTQRNLRPPVFTSTNRIGMLHFGQIGGGEFLGMGSISLSPRRELNTLSHRQQPKARNGDKSPCAFNGPIASQFRAIDTVLRHSAISSLDRRSHFRSAGSELRLAASHSNDQHCLASTVAQLHPISSLPISDGCSWQILLQKSAVSDGSFGHFAKDDRL